MNGESSGARHRGQQGFTLIELLVVMALLAILGGIVVFSIGNSAKNAETAGCRDQKREIIVAMEAYRVDHTGHYAPDEAALVAGGYLKTQNSRFTYTSPTDGPPSIVGTAGPPNCTAV